jgi:hypothetical protein
MVVIVSEKGEHNDFGTTDPKDPPGQMGGPGRDRKEV